MDKEMKELRTDLDEILDTALAVQGKTFSDLTRYSMNTISIVKAIQMATEEEDQELLDIAMVIIGQNMDMLIKYMELPQDKVKEALNLATVLHQKIKDKSSKLEGKS